MNKTSLASIKPGAFLVNTARGALVDEVALASALSSGRVAAVALDVHEHEPFDVSTGPLAPHCASGRVLSTPHSAFYSKESAIEMRQLGALEMRRALLGQPLATCVNKAHLVPRYAPPAPREGAGSAGGAGGSLKLSATKQALKSTV